MPHGKNHFVSIFIDMFINVPCRNGFICIYITLLSLYSGLLAMGLITGSFKFLMGMGCGVYVAQNYNVPNVKKLFNTYVFLAKHLEETYRKPKKDDDGHTP
jgi:hypothetical protein